MNEITLTGCVTKKNHTCIKVSRELFITTNMTCNMREIDKNPKHFFLIVTR